MPHAILHLDDHSVLEGCELLLRLACVQRRRLEEARPSRAVALLEVLLELLPQTLDHPCCGVLRVLAGLEPGTAGRRREERQRLAGDRLGPVRYPATPRTVRRRVKADCWPWLLDRLIELETENRRALDASAATLRSATTPQVSATQQIGVELSTVGRWERGTPTPQPWGRSNLATVLKQPPEELDGLLNPPATDRGQLSGE